MKFFLRHFLVLLFLAITPFGYAQPMAGADREPLPPDEAFRFKVSFKGPQMLIAELVPAKSHYLYKNKVRFAMKNASGVLIRQIQLPAGEVKHDQFFGTIEVDANGGLAFEWDETTKTALERKLPEELELTEPCKVDHIRVTNKREDGAEVESHLIIVRHAGPLSSVAALKDGRKRPIYYRPAIEATLLFCPPPIEFPVKPKKVYKPAS